MVIVKHKRKNNSCNAIIEEDEGKKKLGLEGKGGGGSRQRERGKGEEEKVGKKNTNMRFM